MNECKKEEGKEKRKGKNRRLGEREGGGGRGREGMEREENGLVLTWVLHSNQLQLILFR